MARKIERVSLHPMALVAPFEVVTGVRGAVREVSRFYDNVVDADAAAARWASSNSTGHYWARVYDAEREPVSGYNVERLVAR